ncbi:MAG: protein-L-isoaspartate O-methyltransferase, partial [Planctomycetota bacterium]
DEFQHQAYDDHPLPIGGGQTISQPWIVAHQLQLLRLRGHERVLEVGTGCGYVTALLAGLAQEVWSIERLAPLHAAACSVLLDRLACPNIHLRLGDGSVGWPEAAPFDAILVAAAAPRIPRPLVEQLAVGGRLCLPVEEDHQPGDQRMTLVVRTGPAADNLRTERHVGCRFVRLIGAAGWAPEADI